MARQRHAGTSSDAGRSCLSKHQHATKGEALDHLARNLHENRKKGIKTGDLHVYQCAYCSGGWHVGHPHWLSGSNANTASGDSAAPALGADPGRCGIKKPFR